MPAGGTCSYGQRSKCADLSYCYYAAFLGSGWQTKSKALIRDTVKQAYFNTMYVIFICENQSEIHYGMPVRMLLYDSVQYADQLKKKQKENKKAGNLKSSAEFLSGISKGEPFMPVVSVVFIMETTLGMAPYHGRDDLFAG
ncbi:MAG: hypothetical protein ACLRMZ_18400 [Blautia marasmi]